MRVPDDIAFVRELTITPELVRRVARDATVELLTGPRMLAVWALVAAPVAVLVGVTTPGRQGAWAGFVAAVLLPVLVVWRTRRSARRALGATLVPGATVRVQIRDDALVTETAAGSTCAPWSTYAAVRVHRSALLLRFARVPSVVVLPRALLTDDDLALLRARVGAPSSAAGGADDGAAGAVPGPQPAT
ncbi:hypothetical protein ATM99_11860 [Cellulomonas sp. B6]|nr:hypothetical protein ATM99_11860 [Cellulomonas sp. B6]